MSEWCDILINATILPEWITEPEDVLKCLGDINWPIAAAAVQRLIDLGERAVPAVKSALVGRDQQLKEDLLDHVVVNWPKEVVSKLESELTSLLFPAAPDYDYVSVVAIKILSKNKLLPVDYLSRVINFRLIGAKWTVETLEQALKDLSSDNESENSDQVLKNSK